jgi:hypothetical protein
MKIPSTAQELVRSTDTKATFHIQEGLKHETCIFIPISGLVFRVKFTYIKELMNTPVTQEGEESVPYLPQT